MFTTSPATIDSPSAGRAPSDTTASPVLTASPDLQVAAGELADDVPDDERRAHRTLRVVAVRERRSEDAHDGVADELLDDAAERLDLAADALVVRREHAREPLRDRAVRPAR